MEQKYLRSIMRYDPGTGEFSWIASRQGIRPGRHAGSKSPRGYIILWIDYKNYLAHRLAFLYMTGSIPEYVDHINGDPSDNRWENLREASSSENSFNRKISSKNKSGVKGVHWASGKWRVVLYKNGKKIDFGRWTTLGEAEKVAETARGSLHGRFANSGKEL